jgi:uncharacterized membrane protein YpjA
MLMPTRPSDSPTAMNASFFFLILSLLFLGYMTDWNKHVLFLMLVSTGLWMTMIWCVFEAGNEHQSKQLVDRFYVGLQVCTGDY